jgi:hypothetical protein
MGKTISDETKEEFREFCRKRVADAQEEAQEEGLSEADVAAEGGVFGTDDFAPFTETDEDEEPLWEFHASNYNPDTTHDIYELFESVNDEFLIEQHGYDDFVIVPVAK